MEFIDGGVAATPGFKAAGLACGIKKNKALDLALLAAERPCPTVGVFTTNRVKAHPVLDAMAKLDQGRAIQAILVNSGSANACTGKEGMADLRAAIQALAKVTRIPASSILMASTGVIGERLPLAKITTALPQLVGGLSVRGGETAARAIMTTDTAPKEVAVRVQTPEGIITIGGMAKGSGMISPNMATMLAFMTTDALITDRRALRRSLRAAADATFNRVDVDGDTSTNDALLLMAGGASGVNPFRGDPQPFLLGLFEVCLRLAFMIADDGEGLTKLVTLTVTGGKSEREARMAARTVSSSPLVKTAFFGRDPNWGRIMAALGRSGASFREDEVAISVNGVPFVKHGVRAPRLTEEKARKAMEPHDIDLLIDLGAGSAEYVMWGNDLSDGYIKINASYRS